MLNNPSVSEPDTLLNSATEPEGAPTRDNEEESKPKTFSVTIERQITQTYSFEVEADDADAARELVEDEIASIDPNDWDDGFEVADPEIIEVVELGHGPDDADTAD